MSAPGSDRTVVLEDPIDLSEVINTGSTLHIHCDYDDHHELDTDFVRPNAEINGSTLGEAIDVSFEELANEMVDVDKFGFVKKKIIDEGGKEPIEEIFTVTFEYSAYWDLAREPFDWTKPGRPLVWDMRENGLLPGLHTAILSMGVGEVSMFLLSYKVMYSKMGCGTKYKPESDALFYIRLLKSVFIPETRTQISGPNMFIIAHKEARHLFLKGSHFFETRNFPVATRCFNRAVNLMHRCRLANEVEEKRQEKFLLKVYLNLAICYNNSKLPLRACSMCNEIHRLQNIWNNGKALYQNAKALRMIGEFNEAEKKLKRAIQLCPENKDMKQEMKVLKALNDSYDKSNKVFSKLHTEFSTETLPEDFKNAVEEILKQFIQDENICKLTLQQGLNALELEYVKDLCKRYDFTCSVIKKSVVLDKSTEKQLIESLFGEN